jgi:hypothetical protein
MRALMQIIYVPTINDTTSDFDSLFVLFRGVSKSDSSVEINFSKCGFLRQNAVAFIGGMVRLFEQRGIAVRLNWQSMQSQVIANLEKNGFKDAFLGTQGPLPDNAIPYREDRATTFDKNGIVDYLKSKWLGRGWIHISPQLRDAIVGKMWEIYANAFEHSNSPIGLFSCGQYFPRLHALNLTVIDFGVGIPSNVRQFAGNPSLEGRLAMKWAFRPGTTTKPNDMGRGVGLDLIKQFVALNEGKLEVFSHEGHAVIEKGREEYQGRSCFFEGTLVNISLKCDVGCCRFS